MKLSEGDNAFFELFAPFSKYIIAFGVVVFLYMLGIVSYERYECNKVCAKKGFVDFRYKPQGRFSGSSCFCLTEEDLNQKNKIPHGTKVKI